MVRLLETRAGERGPDEHAYGHGPRARSGCDGGRAVDVAGVGSGGAQDVAGRRALDQSGRRREREFPRWPVPQCRYRARAAIYVVVEFLQSAFDIFRLVGRFILEDPNGKPIGAVLHVDRAQFENEDMGGYLMIKQPPGGFPIGNYRVEIHYENITDISLLTLARFKVIPATGAAGQKP